MLEDLGYSTITISDHFGEQLGPIAALMAIADATSTLRIASMVFSSDYRHPAVLAKEAAYAAITDEQANGISYDDLPGDEEVVSRLAPPILPEDRTVVAGGFARKLELWAPGRLADAGQSTRNLLSVAAIADVSQDLHEAEIARLVFDELQTRYKHAELRRILAWIVLRPDDGTVITQALELDFPRHPPEAVVRERSALYARKFLGRLMGKIHD